MSSPCSSVKVVAIQCVANDTTGQCSSCFDPDTFPKDFPASLENIFTSSQVYAVPGTPRFCDVTNHRICEEVAWSVSCCCQEEISAWRQCLVKEVLSPKLNLPQPCQLTCGAEASTAGNGWRFPIGKVAGAGGVIFVLAFLVFFFSRVVLESCLRFSCCRQKTSFRHGLQKSRDNRKSRKRSANADFDIEQAGTCSDLDESEQKYIRRQESFESLFEDEYNEGFEAQVRGSQKGATSFSHEKQHEEDDVDRFLHTGKAEILKQHSSKSLQSFGSEESASSQERKSDDGSTRSLRSTVQEDPGTPRSKKEAIQLFIESRKMGSSRSLKSFVSGEESDDSISSDEESLYTNQNYDENEKGPVSTFEDESKVIQFELAALSADLEAARSPSSRQLVADDDWSY
mmetsp:Transcript_7715/g.14292  ORF Transcript_7715/g.14292 Transcript_7715/m.14292 type:complete len:400 (-) Transcript_7715:1749-2948(-)